MSHNDSDHLTGQPIFYPELTPDPIIPITRPGLNMLRHWLVAINPMVKVINPMPQ